ncbi:hypothetical protein FisN_30Lu090 [Fistulifera solaris]|uniref:Uncharacterized protein n=1 Tax=Fistulifera solaris TaxID=1519565 RepID=A0A1Z5JIW7_FISSO|nr:hypothetical protein FisN_30Lu090 [Fistulifera solaris]|eukprot:GAX13782.1 hypothetical protein FisN_30Lu090 [Fistulifera solaris]
MSVEYSTSAVRYNPSMEGHVFKPTPERMSPTNEILSLMSMSLEEKVTIEDRNMDALGFSKDSVEVTLCTFRWSAGNSAFSCFSRGIASSFSTDSS